MRGTMKILQVMMLVVIFQMAAEAVMRECDICGGTIVGNYTVFDRAGVKVTVCSRCMEQCGRCAQCGVPVKGTRSGDDHVLCDSCRRVAMYCSGCGQLIRGLYYTSADERVRFCAACFETAPRCGACNDLLDPKRLHREDGVLLCDRCRRELPFCAACGHRVVGIQTTFAGYPDVFCQACAERAPRCASCGRPVGKGQKQLPSGDFICGECARTAVMNAGDLKKLAWETERFLWRKMAFKVAHQVQYEMVEQLGGNGENRECGKFVRVNDDFTIKVIRGLSRPRCIETLAHELGHAWQSEHVPDLKDLLWMEGFAQWVAAQALKYYGYDAQLVNMELRQDLYGEGYRKMCDLEKKYGYKGLMSLILGKS